MKTYSISVLLYTFAYLGSASEFQNFQDCEKEYNAKIGELVASSGLPGAKKMWKSLFDELDLNKNGKLSASEIVLKLSSQRLASSDEMSVMLPQAQSWVDLAHSEDGDHELNVESFVKAIGKSIGKIDKSHEEKEKISPITSSICLFFNQRIPQIIKTIKELTECTTFLKQDQLRILATNRSKFISNTWKAVFTSLDQNDDNLVSTDELTQAYNRYNPEEKTTAEETKKSLNSLLPDTNLNLGKFLETLSSLLFGKNATPKATNDLPAKQKMCVILRDVREDVVAWLRKNEQCVTEYKEVTSKRLGRDSKIAKEFIFTTIDEDKNGVVTAKELQNMIHEMVNAKFGFINFASKQTLNDFTLPDNAVEVKTDNDTTFELSLFSVQRHKNWNAFCRATVLVMQSFPSKLNDMKKIFLNLSNTHVINLLQLRINSQNESDKKSFIEKLKKFIQFKNSSYFNTSSTKETSTTGALTTRLTSTATFRQLSNTSLPFQQTTNAITTTVHATYSPNMTNTSKSKNITIKSLSTTIKTAVTGITSTTKKDTMEQELEAMARKTKATEITSTISSEEKELHELLKNKNVAQKEDKSPGATEEKELIELLDGILKN